MGIRGRDLRTGHYPADFRAILDDFDTILTFQEGGGGGQPQRAMDQISLAGVARALALVLAPLAVFLTTNVRAQSSTFTEMPAIAQGPPGTSCPGTGTYVQCTPLGGFGSIMVDGYYTAGDGGGGYFINEGVVSCPTTGATLENGGSIIHDSSGYCFYRLNPPTDVRQWGAVCDVQYINGHSTDPVTGAWTGAYWDATNKWIVWRGRLPGLSTGIPATSEFITVTQIGPGGEYGGLSTTPPVWADRWSKLGNHGGTSPMAPSAITGLSQPLAPGLVFLVVGSTAQAPNRLSRPARRREPC